MSKVLEPGARILLKSSAKRYLGGLATVVSQEPRGKRMMYLVQRDGSDKKIFVYQSEFLSQDEVNAALGQGEKT